MTRKPRKYLDRERTEVNPDWLESREEEQHAQIVNLGPGEVDRYYPDEEHVLPEQGGWIRILSEPHTELEARFRLPVLSMWHARPTYSNVGRIGNRKPYQVVITTPGGDLHLWPHEYQLVPDITQWVGQDPDVEMHTLGGEPVIEEKTAERLFYLQQRGIPRQDALLMLLGELDGSSFVYFTMHPAYVELFAGVGVPLWQHMADNPRPDGSTMRVSLKVSDQ